jgi:hypothetical protein
MRDPRYPRSCAVRSSMRIHSRDHPPHRPLRRSVARGMINWSRAVSPRGGRLESNRRRVDGPNNFGNRCRAGGRVGGLRGVPRSGRAYPPGPGDRGCRRGIQSHIKLAPTKRLIHLACWFAALNQRPTPHALRSIAARWGLGARSSPTWRCKQGPTHGTLCQRGG